MVVEQLDFDKQDGLIPAIIQHHQTGTVLMLGYMNKKAVEKTLDEKRVTFYSRSKQRLWTKGETSGNFLDVVDIQADCDNDTILVLANPHGPACHTGETSCFYEKYFGPFNSKDKSNLDFLGVLQKLIQQRKKQMPEGSYTTSLFEKGVDKIAQKVGEEAIETVIAAKNTDTDELIYEASDLIYHLLVLLTEKGVDLNDLVKELETRHR